MIQHAFIFEINSISKIYKLLFNSGLMSTIKNLHVQAIIRIIEAMNE